MSRNLYSLKRGGSGDTERCTILVDASELTFVHIEGECPHCNTHHALTVVEKLDGFSVQGKVPQMLWDEGVMHGPL